VGNKNKREFLSQSSIRIKMTQDMKKFKKYITTTMLFFTTNTSKYCSRLEKINANFSPVEISKTKS
jgi:hypothetical protein